jgi:hypothetical protein
MRQRASAESTRWRSEAIAEADTVRKQAQSDAVQLRSDAWSTSEQMLSQCQLEARRVAEHAEKESLRKLGEAEREAHRLQSAARREAEDLVRTAKMEVERLAAEARARHDEIIDAAMRQAEAAQERTRALEQRRGELMGELESVRSALNEVEGELDQRRERLGLSASPATPENPKPGAAKTVIPENPSIPTSWYSGETVRVVRPSKPGEAPDAPEVTSQPPQPEVRIFSAAELAARKVGASPPTPAPHGEEHPGDAGAAAGEDSEQAETADEGGFGWEEAVSAVRSSWETRHEDEDLDVEPLAEVARPAVALDAAGDHHDDEDLAEADTEPDDAPAVEPDAGEPETPVDDEAAAAHGIHHDEPETVGLAPAEPDPGGSSGAGSDESGQTQLFTEVAGLFDRLRVNPPASPAAPAPAGAQESELEPITSRRLAASMLDPFEIRDRLLLPAANRALRNLKRQLTEEQNVALEELRLHEEEWEPTLDAVTNRVRADLVVLFAESFGAGHAAVEEMLGGRVSRPATPRREVAEDFAATLTDELLETLAEGRAAGHGARQLGASLSRVFRGWRTDQAERRVRELSLSAFHEGFLRAMELSGEPSARWVLAGRGCATCRAATEDRPEELFPPAHPGCECTLAP